MAEAIAAEEFLGRLAAGERDFQGANLSSASLRWANLRGVNLRGANLRGVRLHGADLREARLMRTDLGMADLSLTDLSGADLNSADFRASNLKGANFSGATLSGAILRGADLNGADLRTSNLVRADLSRADLGKADIRDADLRGTDLRGASLQGANLGGASLQNATLHGADLRAADLSAALLLGANLTDARLEASIFTDAHVGSTVFGDLDLREARGLSTLHHAAPSTVGADTLRRSMGQIPQEFLRGCGFTPLEILTARSYDVSLTPDEAAELDQQIRQARDRARLQRRRVFILHSEADAAFVTELRRLLLDRGVFSWVAVHERRGALRERQSKLATQHNLALLLVLSQNSVLSDWVEHEVRLARKLEASLGEEILSLIGLDASWETAPFQAKAADKVVERPVFSFARWSDTSSMETNFEKLFARMDLFYPRSEAGPKN